MENRNALKIEHILGPFIPVYPIGKCKTMFFKAPAHHNNVLHFPTVVKGEGLFHVFIQRWEQAAGDHVGGQPTINPDMLIYHPSQIVFCL